MRCLLEVTESGFYMCYPHSPEKSFYSQHWEAFFGFSPSQVSDPIQEKAKLVVADFKKVYTLQWEAFTTQKRIQLKYQIKQAGTGKLIWLEEEVLKKTDPETNEEVWVGTIRVVSGAEFYKEYIAESEQRFKAIADSTPIMIWVSDENDKIIYQNEEAKKMFGLTDDMQVSVGDMSDWVEPEYKQVVIEEWDNRAAKREPIDVEMPLKTADGTVRYLALRAMPRFLKNGIFVGYIGTTYDLTREYNFKKQAEQSIDILRMNEEKFRNLFENLSLGVLEVDVDDKVLYANDAFLAISGYKKEELLGKIAKKLLLTDKKSTHKLEEQNESRQKGKSAVYELPIKRKNGEIALTVISGAPTFDAAGKVKGSVGIHWDVTKLRAIEKALLDQEIKKEHEIAEARMQAEDQQRYAIGQDLHDGVGQMLVLINMYVGLIRSNGALSAKELTTLEEAIQKTIGQVRNLSRLLAPPELRDLGLRESIRELIHSCAVVKKPTLSLKIYPPEEDYNLNLDKKRMVYRVVQELLNNTFKHADAATVFLHLYFDKKKFYLQYEDDGQGFDKEKIRKGVGLESIQSRITYFKGTLQLESIPGKGTKTFITLPIG
jgi:two-component system, sporulation sensor kinase E